MTLTKAECNDITLW